MIKPLAACIFLTGSLLLVSCDLGCPDGKPLPTTGTSIRAERGKISAVSFERLFLHCESGSAFLIDARDSWFYRQGRIPGAINLPTDEHLDEALQQLTPELEQAIRDGRTLVVYCSGFGCKDARTVSRRIACMGLDVSVYGAGWKGWQKMGMATESASQEQEPVAPPSAP